MELNKLYYFKVVAETGHMTEAAEKLFTSQPYLSKSIKLLEEELNVQLFNRSKRGIELNEAGKVYYDYVSKIFETLENGSKAVQDLNNALDNTIKIGTNACSFLPSFFNYAKTRHQQLTIYQETQTIENLLSKLREGTIDYMFAVAPNELSEQDDIGTKLLLKDQMRIILPTDSPLAKKKELKFEEISDLPIVTAPKGFGLTDALLHQFSIHDKEPNIQFTTTDIAVIPKYVANHLGISAFPTSLLPYINKANNIENVSLADSSFVINLYVMWNKKRYHGSLSEWFNQMIEEFYCTPEIQKTS
ncbi:LysR family transcriptional regulator [Enterococcus hulanensis]|uniref:LysR family transcriptional regulator n=1 Tax=Enterococcus hulanensis TaxID=2559929 RepID=UPI00288D8726|nr:LysR family transcriptional regulator [Enterococcus hulanensis]MDT2659252.1 LysR family transcriptional regulator [Enterococcus hulanensis]